MRLHSKLMLALAMSILALGPMACTSSSWCADCEQATTILGLNYQPVNTYTVGTAIPVNPPNPTGGTPRIYTVESGALPPGLSLDPATGRITGTPTAAGLYILTIRGANSANSASQTIQITVVPAQPLGLSYATPQVFPAASAIAVQNPVLTQATPGLATTYAITAGSLPAGLNLNTDGTISGTPTTPGVFPFTATATNGARTATASATYTVTPAGSLGLTYATPLVFGAGLAIPAQAAALLNPTPGVPTTYDVTAGTLPAGLALNAATGDITGAPTMPGVYPFTVTATNGTRAATSSPTYTVTPAAALALAYVTPQTFTSGTAIGTQVATLSNPTPGVATTYALTGGTFPSGLSLDPVTGSITGTPNTPGVYTFTAMATNGTRNASATATYTVVPAGGLGLDYTSPQTFPAGSAIATQVPSVTNPTPGLTTTFAITGGTLPAGLTLNADGTITGTPTTPGVYNFTVTATNGSRTATSSPIYTVTPAAALTVDYSTPQIFTAGTAIATQTPTVANATPGVTTTFAITGGTLPAGLTLNADGTITGTPTTPGVYSFTVTATNGSRTATANVSYTVTPAAALTESYPTPATFTAGTAIATQTPTITNATPGVTTTFAITGGTLPAGLTLNADGTITGTPTTPGVYSFTVTATNGSRTATANVSYTVTPAAALTESYPTPATFTAGTAIATQTPTITNATPGVTTTFAITGGTLPAGLTLNADGTITGTPTTPGVYSFTVTATNGSRTAIANVSYTVTPAAALTESYPTPATFTAGTAIATQTPTITNATPGVTTTFAITGGTLPAGLTLNADGTITGTPTTPGVYSFTVTATNGSRTATANVSYTVTPAAALTESYPTPATFTAGTAIATQTPTITNATPGVTTTFAITGGTLPAGLTLNADGTITGTPTTPGVYSFTVTATNGSRTATANVSYTVTPAAALTESYPTPATFTAGTAIATQTPTITNATPGVTTTFAITGGTLPAGLTLNADGTITGTPTTPGVYSFTVTATNGSRTATANVSYTVNAAAPTALNYASPVTYTSGIAIANNNPNPSGGAPTSYTISSGSLPSGLSLDPTTGVISGTPSATGSFTVTISGTNLAGGTNQTLSITVLAPLSGSLTANPSLVSVGQASALTAIFAGGTATIDQGFGAVATGSSLPTGVYATPGTYTYAMVVTNGFNSITSTATVTVVATPPNSIAINVPTGGVTSTVNSPGSPLDGLSVVVPSQGSAVCADTVLTVVRQVGVPLPGPLGTGVVAVSDPWTFSSTVGYPFRTPMVVTLPYDSALLAASDVPVPFYWDPAYGKWITVGLKALDTTNHRVTFTTLMPGQYAVLAIPGLGSSLTTQSLGFNGGTDSWFQPNQGSYDTPGGAGLGMSSYAAWYFGFKKASNNNAGLYTQLLQGNLASTADDVNARALISRLGNGTLDCWNQLWTQGTYQLSGLQTGLALITGLRVSAQPQIFLMGEARPAVSGAMATLVTGYDLATGKFGVLDPNYPGMPLTITWNSGTGAFTAYDRSSGYVPTFTQYALEGQTSIHRLSDYERVFDGANGGWTNPPFATVAVTDVAATGSPVSGLATVPSGTGMTVSGSVTNGDATASHILWSQNGGSKTPVALAAGTFSFTVPTLADPYGTRIAIETTGNPCDPTFTSTGYSEFIAKVLGKTPWFPNICFESGSTAPWTLEQGSNNGVNYPALPTWSAATGEMTNFGITWSAGSIDSTLVNVANDPNVSTIPQVYDGSWAFRVNNPATGAHISRVQQVITIPADVNMPKLTFVWAAVMQSAGHTAAQQPFVDIIVEDVTNANERVYYKHFYANDPGYPGWIAGSGTGTNQWFGINWQQVNLTDLSARKGHQLRIRVVAADCTLGGHGGYAYLDGVNCN